MAASRCAVRVFGGVRDAVNPGEEWRKSFKFGDGRGGGEGTRNRVIGSSDDRVTGRAAVRTPAIK